MSPSVLAHDKRQQRPVPALTRLRYAVGWELFIRRTLASRAAWDLCRSGRLRDKVDRSLLYFAEEAPIIAADDPIFGDPFIGQHHDPLDGFLNRRTQYAYRVTGDLIVEPEYGYLIKRPLGLIDQSLQYAELTRRRETIPIFSGLPSVPDVLLKTKRQGGMHVDRLISFRHPFEWNYYHFLLDILPRIWLLDELGIDRSIPILIGQSLAKQRFFREMQSLSPLRERTWLIQDDSFVTTREVIIVKTALGHRDQLDYAANGVPARPGGLSERVFIERKSASGRNITNMAAVARVARDLGYTVVDPAELSITEQIELFGRTEVLVGSHGAGLANMIFRRGRPLTLLEIFPPTAAPLHFYILAKMYGYAYHYMVGKDPTWPGERGTDFAVDLRVLGERLQQLRGDH